MRRFLVACVALLCVVCGIGLGSAFVWHEDFTLWGAACGGAVFIAIMVAGIE